VKEAGLDYICDFYHDDQPTPLAAGTAPDPRPTMDINDALIHRQPFEAEESADDRRPFRHGLSRGNENGA
jgi:hypothetical protein